MLTVTALARCCGLSRSTVLYYESVHLLKPARRTAGNYRAYGEADVERLRRICAYREAGLTLDDIRALLDRPHTDAAAVLTRRMASIGDEIARMKAHQQAIARLLRSAGRSLGKAEMLTKDQFVKILKNAGLTEVEMRRFHAEFEKSAPEEHEEFLRYLHIPADEIRQIRDSSRAAS